MPAINRTNGVCEYCGEEFTRKRVSGKFCKQAHRTAYHRLKLRINARMQAALDASHAIIHLTEEHPHLRGDAKFALQRIADYARWKTEPLL